MSGVDDRRGNPQLVRVRLRGVERHTGLHLWVVVVAVVVVKLNTDEDFNFYT